MSGPTPDSCCPPERPERPARAESLGEIGQHFDKRYQEWEPIAPEATDLLFTWLREEGLAGSTIMDIGCGTGELLVRALEAGATRGSGADLSSAAIAMASDLAHETGNEGRLDLWVGDAAVEPLDAHDVVVLDKVICCYPDAGALIARSTDAARHLYAFAVPESTGFWGLIARARWFVFGLMELIQGSHIPRFVHDRREVQAKVEAAGFRPLHTGRQFVWFVAVYGREPVTG
ncbi:MAG TPA: methyltransferase domain-containing protein [Candidatus Limnocylindria bacterium]|jgi:magnesium-protoporphyrin O-methyltransferase